MVTFSPQSEIEIRLLTQSNICSPTSSPRYFWGESHDARNTYCSILYNV